MEQSAFQFENGAIIFACCLQIMSTQAIILYLQSELPGALGKILVEMGKIMNALLLGETQNNTPKVE